MGPRYADIILPKQRYFRMMRNIILPNLVAMGPRAAEIILQNLVAMGPRDAVWVRAMRYGSARCGMGPRDAVWVRAMRRLFERHFTNCEFFPLIHTNISK
jgi:hypothetical protein